MAIEGVSDAILKLVPEWAAYWLRFENDAIVMEATAPRPETAIGPTENRDVDDRRARAVVGHLRGDQPRPRQDAQRDARPVRARTRPTSRCSTSSTRASASSAAPTPRSAGSATRPSSSTTRRDPGGRPDRRPDRPGRRRAAVHRAASTFITLGGDQVGVTVTRRGLQRHDDHDRRPRRRRQAVRHGRRIGRACRCRSASSRSPTR